MQSTVSLLPVKLGILVFPSYKVLWQSIFKSFRSSNNKKKTLKRHLTKLPFDKLITFNEKLSNSSV